jgi:hypothetical protein
MQLIVLLNIPNYYSSYYLFGLQQEFKIKFKMDRRFEKFNNSPILIFQINDRLIVIDNDDPSGINSELYQLAEIYFVTNKLKGVDAYEQKKIKPLFPHYPINVLPLYFKIFGLNLFRYLSFKQVLREIYIYTKRPIYSLNTQPIIKDNFVFFSSHIWKKEFEVNMIRAEFIKFCRKDPRIKFEGGFVPRSDGNNLGFDNVLSNKHYSPKVFSKLSNKSKIGLNNPAVCGAVSWRLAEYLNSGLFILSFPFKIELPIKLRHGKEIHFVESSWDYKTTLDKILNEPYYHEKLSLNAKKYFDKFCTPRAQVKYIFDIINKNNSI